MKLLFCLIISCLIISINCITISVYQQYSECVQKVPDACPTITYECNVALEKQSDLTKRCVAILYDEAYVQCVINSCVSPIESVNARFKGVAACTIAKYEVYEVKKSGESTTTTTASIIPTSLSLLIMALSLSYLL